MKFFSLVALMLISNLAEARSIQASRQYVLPNVTIDGEKTSYTGHLNVNFLRNETVLEVFDDICGAMTAEVGEIHCMAVAQKVATLRAPLLTKKVDGCGSEHFAGMIDETRHDGSRTEIEVTDNSRRLCDDVIASLVVVRASSFNPWTGKTTNYELKK